MKYGTNISRSMSSVTNGSRPSPKERLRSQNSTPLITVTPQTPLSRRVRSQGNLHRKLYDSSADSATEYDSVNSAKSTIYLHAATGKFKNQLTKKILKHNTFSWWYPRATEFVPQWWQVREQGRAKQHGSFVTFRYYQEDPIQEHFRFGPLAAQVPTRGQPPIRFR